MGKTLGKQLETRIFLRKNKKVAITVSVVDGEKKFEISPHPRPLFCELKEIYKHCKTRYDPPSNELWDFVRQIFAIEGTQPVEIRKFHPIEPLLKLLGCICLILQSLILSRLVLFPFDVTKIFMTQGSYKLVCIAVLLGMIVRYRDKSQASNCIFAVKSTA